MRAFPKRNKISRRCDLEKNLRYRQLVGFEPNCYWYSIGRGWYNYWFKKLKREKVSTQVVCDVKIPESNFTTLRKSEKGKILIIETEREILEVTKRFGVTHYGITLIDFTKLAKIFSGIEFRNYSMKKAPHPEELWYHKIAVSSGCIWDLSVIESTEVKGKLREFI